MSVGTFVVATLQLLLLPVFGALLLVISPIAWLYGKLLFRWPRVPAPKNILITGASGGLGEGLAVHYAAPGVVIGITARRESALKDVAEACRAKGATVVIGVCDVTNAAGTEEFIHKFDEKHPLDLLIANAGVSEGTLHSAGVTEMAAKTRAIFDINVNGVLNTVLPAIAKMQPRRHGQIVIMSSVAGFGGMGGFAAYCASKSAVRAYGLGLRQFLARDNIAVNVICPGFVHSPMTAANKFPMPFIVDSDAATRIMANGIASNRAVITYPNVVHIGAWFLQMVIPDGVKDLLLPFTAVKARRAKTN